MFNLLHKVRGSLTGSPHHKYSLGSITADFHARSRQNIPNGPDDGPDPFKALPLDGMRTNSQAP